MGIEERRLGGLISRSELCVDRGRGLIGSESAAPMSINERRNN
jgi:hypothetical protein